MNRKIHQTLSVTFSFLIPFLESGPHSEIGDTQCHYDSVSVYEGNRADIDKRLGQFCGADAPTERFKANRAMLVRFLTDSSVVEKKGFKASFEIRGENLKFRRNASFLAE